jgi:phosphopantothenoylcysteine decarboxylase/phosphopantothenate--cysteine ligase
MYEAVRRHLPGTDVFVGAAAVVDYRPARILKKKIKRRRPSVSLRLVGNPDIIAMIGHLPKNRPVTVIGFALETGHLLENAAEKLMRKRLDWIVANRPSALGQESGEVTLLSRWGDKVTLKRATKVTLAKKIWQTILKN